MNKIIQCLCDKLGQYNTYLLAHFKCLNISNSRKKNWWLSIFSFGIIKLQAISFNPLTTVIKPFQITQTNNIYYIWANCKCKQNEIYSSHTHSADRTSLVSISYTIQAHFCNRVYLWKTKRVHEHDEFWIRTQT